MNLRLPQAVIDKEAGLAAYLEKALAAFAGLKFQTDKSAQPIMWLGSAADVAKVVELLKKDPELQFDRLSDLTAYDNVDKIDGDKRFVAVYELYSMTFHIRLRMKVLVDENESVPSLTGIFKAANWLEREAYDMYGITFSDHPDLRRILMDERFEGFPLRKEYGLKERQPFADSQPLRIMEKE